MLLLPRACRGRDYSFGIQTESYFLSLILETALSPPWAVLIGAEVGNGDFSCPNGDPFWGGFFF